MSKYCKTILSLVLASAIALPLNALELEEVIVTAQKREQNLQDVPLSILAISGDDIQAGGFENMEDLATFVPNLFMSDALTGQNLFMRGIGSTVANEAFEQAVAQFHDGVYYGRDNLSQNGFFDLERIEVVRGPQPVFAGQSATAGALSYISRRPGKEPEGSIMASYGNDEEVSIEAAFGGPVSDTFGVRISGRFYELGETGYTHVLTGDDLGTKENTSFRVLGVWTPNDKFEATFKYEFQDVSQIGVPREYTRCETTPNLSVAFTPLAPAISALCALDAAYNGIDLDSLDGVVGSGGAQDVLVAMNELNAASGATFGSPNYWGAPMPLFVSPVASGLNKVGIFNEDEERDQQVDVLLLAFDWGIGDNGIVMSSQTSSLQYDKHDILDPDMSSFAVFVGERREDFKQISQEIRFTSAQDQKFSWMVGAYYQEHDLTTAIQVHLPWTFDIPLFLFGAPPNPANDGYSAISYGGPLVENSKWTSLFFSTTWNLSDTFRINVGGRHQSIDKTGTENPQVARLPTGGSRYEALSAIGPPVSGRIDASDFLPEVGFQWDASDAVMIYAKYSEALKAGGFVKSPPIGGAVPDPFTYDNEVAEGFEAGIKALLFDGRLTLNASYYDTDFTDLQVTILNADTASFETQNAAAAHTTGFEIDGRWAVTDNFSVGFAGSVSEAQYDDYFGPNCNTLDEKIGPTGKCQFHPDNPGALAFNASGVTLPYAPDWVVNLQPEYLTNVNGFDISIGANMVWSDGFSIAGVTGDPLSEAAEWMRIDLRLAIAPVDGKWELAVYGRDVTDERRQHTNAYSFLSRSLAPVYDAGGIGRERGARYGVQLRVLF
jgi:outer membrane receptor protein involved in Fe transport